MRSFPISSYSNARGGVGVGSQDHLPENPSQAGVTVWADLGQVERRLGPVDVLVNNAGIMQVGPLEWMTLQDYRKALETHFWEPLYAIEAVVPGMKSRGRGRISTFRRSRERSVCLFRKIRTDADG